MIHFNKTVTSGGIDPHKSNESRERDICYYWHFLDKGFKYQKNVMIYW